MTEIIYSLSYGNNNLKVRLSTSRH